MSFTLTRSIVLVPLVLSTQAFGSGYLCEGSPYNVRAHDRADGSGKPAIFVVSDHYEHPRTLLRAKGARIEKLVHEETVEYVVRRARRLDKDKVVLKLHVKEDGAELSPGDPVDGELLLYSVRGEEDAHKLSCTRR